jgi:hypothetical protein
MILQQKQGYASFKMFGSNRQSNGSRCNAFLAVYLAMNQNMPEMQPNKATHCSHQRTVKPKGKGGEGGYVQIFYKTCQYSYWVNTGWNNKQVWYE